MISIESTVELQRYIKVNADYSIEYLKAFYAPANASLIALIGPEMSAKAENLTEGDLFEASRRFVVVKALLLSKGMQNVKMSDEGFTRYSEFGKNTIAASSDAMRLFADDLTAYAACCEELVLSLCEADSDWVLSRYSTVNRTWLSNVDLLEELSGKRISRIEFRKRSFKINLYQTALCSRFGKEVWSIVISENSDEAKEAFGLVKQIIAGSVADDYFSKSNDYDLMMDALESVINSNKESFGLTNIDFGAFDTGGSVCL